MSNKSIVMDSKDNIATAIKELKKDENIEVEIGEKIKKIVINQEVPFGHKFALTTISQREDVIKYGEIIGAASKDISVGDYVHVHNLESKRGRGDLKKVKEGKN